MPKPTSFGSGTTKIIRWRDTHPLSVAEGVAIAKKQRDYYAALLPHGPRESFLSDVDSMLDKARETSSSGYDVPRGLDIERVFYAWKGK